MPRYGLILAGLMAAMNLITGGCRSCSSGHDYDPPVAGCQCDAYGTHRAGSACGGGCSTCDGGAGGTGGECSTCNGGGYVEGSYPEAGTAPVEESSDGMLGEPPAQTDSTMP